MDCSLLSAQNFFNVWPCFQVSSSFPLSQFPVTIKHQLRLPSPKQPSGFADVLVSMPEHLPNRTPEKKIILSSANVFMCSWDPHALALAAFSPHTKSPRRLAARTIGLKDRLTWVQKPRRSKDKPAFLHVAIVARVSREVFNGSWATRVHGCSTWHPCETRC